ncbi:cytochrome c maturation protein CcmE [Paracoccaceae bacterium]|nr:cytochrome c maturation protein CcmE [Paracoccaceae bacterium]
MRIIFISCGMFVLLVTTVILLFAFRSGIEFYKSPTQLLEVKDASIKLRVGGLVMKDSVESTGVDNSFVITDGNNEVEVKFVGVLPDLFAEGRGVIARGQFRDNVFVASQVLAKHDEKYMPRELEKTLNGD